MLTQADQCFADKTAKVVVVDASSAGRHILGELVKSFGFQDVRGTATAKDVLALLEIESVDWLVMPLCADQEVNALQFLKLAMFFPQLRGLRITLLIEDSEQSILPLAFEMGLLSWLGKPYNKDTLRAELQTLLAFYEDFAWNSTYTAACYLRRFLRQTKKYEALLHLEKGLVESAPGQCDLILQVAEAEFLRGEHAAAMRTIGQVCLLDPRQEPVAKELARKYLGDQPLPSADPAAIGGNVLGLGSCVIVDPDSSIQKGLGELLQGLGITKVEIFSDGEAACQWLKANPEPAVIFHEWRLAKVKGPMFVQRVRQMQYFDVAMIVVSSLVQQQDLPIIREMGVANIIPKPIERDRLLSTLVAMVQQDRTPSEHKDSERRIRMALAAGNITEATLLKIKYFQDPKLGEGKRAHIDAEFAYASGDYMLCRDQAIIALKQAGDSVILLNLLGKAFMQLRDFKNALRCFEKAQAISPLNIGRLFDLAEVQTELGDAGKANESLASVHALDPTNDQLPSKQVQCAVNQGETKLAHQLMQHMESVDHIVAYLNNRAVALTRCGRLLDSVELYRRSLAALPEKFGDARAILHYNLALAYAKRQKLTEAAAELTFACQAATPRVRSKATSLQRRIGQALKHQRPLQLNTVADGEGLESPGLGRQPRTDPGLAAAGGQRPTGRDQDVLASLLVRRGDIGCYLLFKCPLEARDAPAEKLAASLPRFQPREHISREETFGLDKINARG